MFKAFIQVAAPLPHRPVETTKTSFKISEPYPIGSILRVVGTPDGHPTDEISLTFVVSYYEESFSNDLMGPYYYDSDDGFMGSWSNYVEPA